MGLFNKKRKMSSKSIAEETHVAEEEVKETVKAVDDARITLEEIKDELNRMNNDSSLAYAMKISADKNYKKMKALNNAMDAENKNSGRNRIYDLEKDLYIINSENDSYDLDSYNRALSDLSKFFNDKEAAESVMTGADKINIYLMQYVKRLEEALRSGKKMKANACIDVLKYALTVGYRDEGIMDPEKLEKRINEKVEFVNNTCKDLLSAIDEYYKNIADYEIEEYAYKKAFEEYSEKSGIIDEIPRDIYQKIENLGFKRASKLPQGDEARQYMTDILSAQASATKVLFHSGNIEALLLQLVNLKSDIDEFLNKCKHALTLGAGEFDYDEHNKTIMEMRKRSIDQINKMNDMAAESQRMNEETISMINEASENAALGRAVSDSLKTINRLNQINRKNEELNARIRARKAEIEREKQEQNLEIQTMSTQNSEELLEN